LIELFVDELISRPILIGADRLETQRIFLVHHRIYRAILNSLVYDENGQQEGSVKKADRCCIKCILNVDIVIYKYALHEKIGIDKTLGKES